MKQANITETSTLLHSVNSAGESKVQQKETRVGETGPAAEDQERHNSYKTCVACGIDKPLNEFWLRLNGHEATCKHCRCIRRYDERLRERKAAGLKTLALTTREAREYKAQGLRYCAKCARLLPTSSFSTTYSKGRGIVTVPTCKECVSATAFITKHRPEQIAKRRKKYIRDRRAWRERKLMKVYGITYAKYEQISQAQQNRCAICGKTKRANRKDLAVDHDHDTGAMRGLLCSPCNAGLGFFHDNVDKLNKAIAYLKRYGK